MNDNPLSIVNIIPEEYKDVVNELAYILGMGENNLSIKLQDQDGKIYYACHSWWNIDKYILFKDHVSLSKMGVNIQEYKNALLYLREFIIDSRNISYGETKYLPSDNLYNALSEMGLSIIENLEETYQ